MYSLSYRRPSATTLTSWLINTYSYKKINHKKYIECEINLLRDVIAKLHAHFDIFAVCIHKIYYERRNAEYEHEHHLKKRV